MAKRTKRFYDILCGDEQGVQNACEDLDKFCPGIEHADCPLGTYPFVRVFCSEQEWLRVRFYLKLDKAEKVYFY